MMLARPRRGLLIEALVVPLAYWIAMMVDAAALGQNVRSATPVVHYRHLQHSPQRKRWDCIAGTSFQRLSTSPAA